MNKKYNEINRLNRTIDLQLFAEDSSEDSKEDTQNEDLEEKKQVNKEDEKENNKKETKTIELTPEVKQFFEEQLKVARQQEKDKLYSKIETLKSELKGVTDMLEQAKDKLTSLEEKQTQKTDSEEEVKTGEITNANNSKIKELEEQIKKITDALKVQTEETKKSKLTEYRNQAIAKANLPSELGEMIPLTSEEEVNDAVKKMSEAINKVVPGGINKPNAPALGIAIEGEEFTPEHISSMTPEQFIEFRKKNPSVFGGGQHSGYQGFGTMALRRQ